MRGLKRSSRKSGEEGVYMVDRERGGVGGSPVPERQLDDEVGELPLGRHDDAPP